MHFLLTLQWHIKLYPHFFIRIIKNTVQYIVLSNNRPKHWKTLSLKTSVSLCVTLNYVFSPFFMLFLDFLFLSDLKWWIHAHNILNKPLFLSLTELLYEELPLNILVDSLLAFHLHFTICAIVRLRFLFYHLQFVFLFYTQLKIFNLLSYLHNCTR